MGETVAVDDDLGHLFREYRASKSRRIRNELIERHRGLAITIAGDYRHRGIEHDDLRQVATVGLLKAVERFDPERGVPFGAFASRTINGEVKRWFRDHGWSVRPPRGLQEMSASVRRAIDDLTQRYARSPTVPEVAAYLGEDEDDVLQALEVTGAFTAASLDAPVGDDGAAPTGPASIDADLEQADLRIAVQRLLATLEEREATIVRRYFFDEMSQAVIADELGISQMHVSRLLRRSLEALRARWSAPAGG